MNWSMSPTVLLCWHSALASSMLLYHICLYKPKELLYIKNETPVALSKIAPLFLNYASDFWERLLILRFLQTEFQFNVFQLHRIQSLIVCTNEEELKTQAYLDIIPGQLQFRLIFIPFHSSTSLLKMNLNM